MIDTDNLYCDCGRKVWVARRREGFLNVWRIVCQCGLKSKPAFTEAGAVHHWQTQIFQTTENIKSNN